MDARPEIPDPEHDRHVAFPDEPPSSLPQSWWEPTPPALLPIPRPWERQPQPRRRRGNAWAGIVLLLLLGGFVSQGHGTTSGGSGGSGYVDAPAPGSVELVQQPTAPTGELEPDDARLYSIPQGTVWFRLEVVGNDPRAAVEVTTDRGYDLNAGGFDLPYAGRLTRNNPEDALTVTVRGSYGQKQVQCRVYVGDALVAIGTGDGTATCEVPAWR